LEDRRWVEEVVVDRSERAFKGLYRRYTPRMLNCARRLLRGDHVEAEDAVQEAWMRAIRGLGGFSWESGLSTWLVGITLNVAREIRRKTMEVVTMDGYELMPATGGGVSAEMGIDLERAMARLSPGRHAVLTLHDLEGYTHREIADLLDISAGTSKSQLFDARRFLRARLTGRRSPVDGAP